LYLNVISRRDLSLQCCSRSKPHHGLTAFTLNIFLVVCFGYCDCRASPYFASPRHTSPCLTLPYALITCVARLLLQVLWILLEPYFAGRHLLIWCLCITDNTRIPNVHHHRVRRLSAGRIASKCATFRYAQTWLSASHFEANE
jgi:hypothetical protein